MATGYNPQKIEKKWQRIWKREKAFRASDRSKKQKFYLLVEFPYPSGGGLHVGHCRSYVGLDVIARKRRMEGFNVLFPMGWDAFGLPTENYAVKTGIHPAIVTRKNTANFKRQQKSLGLSFDWSREINTTDPDYYKWTQWIFLRLFKKGLAYKAKIPINWCPSCKIGLANEEVINGKCERCGAETAKKEKEQWMLKITRYAERLINDLSLVDYPERVKTSQKEWIGKSEGVEIKFQVVGYPRSRCKFQVPVFTTRPDTLFGCTYLVIAPEHPLIENIKSEITNYKFVKNYIDEAKRKGDRERISGEKEKNGVELRGIRAINPINGREIPLFTADYVLENYGTGAIMAVPAHDQRDFDFAKKYNLPIIEVIKPTESKPPSFKRRADLQAYEGEGILINSGRFSGMKSEKAKERITEWLSKKGLARKAVYYKLRDWIFSRQRYWGEPIPMVECGRCGWVPAEEKELPIKLPRVKEYKPTGKGESPLAKVESWVNVRCPKCGGPAKRETDVMPNWAGSNWYYLRYCDPQNDKKLASQKLLKYWTPVDWYNGGMEHTTLHLLYSRFIYKFLWDIGVVPKLAGSEPYKKRTSHGVVLAEGGAKMSKSKGNVINPDKIVKQYGADTLRVYEMFMGPFEQAIPWDTKGLKGARRFLERVWNLQNKVSRETALGKGRSGTARAIKDKELERLLHKTINKVGADIESLKFNTAISFLMVLANRLEKQKKIPFDYYSSFLVLLNPFAPHLSEELWERAGLKGVCRKQKWPKYNRELVKEKTITLVAQINGKVRDKIKVKAGISESEAKELALSREKIKKWINGRRIKIVIFVPGKLINFVI
jgi:leucyl-tRNA synthetase